jgi:IclR family transcriptional regulator, acetate operon repressor
VKSVRNALRVLETVAERQPVGVSEVARALELPKASVQRALVTLGEAGWIRQVVDEPGRWVVTARLAVLADATPDVVAVREAARAELDALRDATRESVALFVLDGDRPVLMATVHSPQVVRAEERAVGPVALHASATGRVLLAWMRPATRDAVLRRRPASDGATRAEIDAELERTRTRGYAVSDRELADELTSISGPVLDATGAVLAAITVFGPSYRFDADVIATIGKSIVASCTRVTAALTPRRAATGAVARSREVP